jgi:hypothetical protein
VRKRLCGFGFRVALPQEVTALAEVQQHPLRSTWSDELVQQGDGSKAEDERSHGIGCV